MRVEKLELNGFKSFADKTVFALHEGITCIVGPNGCGKSNVVDAFKWVLGEQSAKSLRGDKMEEVIFNGSAMKKPKGMSHVALYVKGVDITNPKSATTVTRRLYRSGDSDYMLNNFSCRLKDIRDLFLDTGLEMKSYSIFEQDRISAVIGARPVDRRFLIEEVAGVVKYKVRRHEALNKLESSKGNLLRITDVINEVRRQTNSLDRQVKKARRYETLMADLRQVELRLAKRDYEGLSRSLEEALLKLSALREKDASLRAEIDRRENDLEALRLKAAEKEKVIQEKASAYDGLKNTIASAEQEEAVLQQDIRGREERRPRLKEQLSEAGGKLEALKLKSEEVQKTISEREREKAGLEAEHEKILQTLSAGEEECSDMEARLETFRKETFSAADRLSGLKNEHHTILTAVEGLRKRIESLGGEKVSVQNRLEAVESSWNSLKQEAEARRAEVEGLKSDREALAENRAELALKHESLKAELTTLREALASDVSRLEALGEVVYGDSEENLPQNLKSAPSVADILRVPAEYEKAVEAALGELVSGLILPGFQDASEAARSIRDREVGRTPFIPETSVGPSAADSGRVNSSAKKASELVSASEEKYSEVVRRLLHGVFVVEELKHCLPEQLSPGEVFVTSRGEVVDHLGTVTGGTARGVLTRKRQMRELEAEIEKKKKTCAKLQEDISALFTDIEEKDRKIASLVEAVVEGEKNLSLKMQSLDREAEEKARVEKKLAFVELEAAGLGKDLDGNIEALGLKEAEIGKAAGEKSSVEQNAEELRLGLQDRRKHVEGIRAETVELKIKINSLKEKIEALSAELYGTGTGAREAEERIKYLENETKLNEARLEELGRETAKKRDAITELVMKADERARELSGLREELSSMGSGVEQARQELRALRAELDPVTGELTELGILKEKHVMKLETIVEAMRVNHEVELALFESEPCKDGDEEALSVLKEKIRALGPVSLGSIEEFEELKQRYEFLSTQKEDLEKSIAELTEAISKINATTRKKLRESFDSLNQKFSEVFERLFGGGKAELVLTDEQNILESGIDIIARPPGKKLQNINLLSGGEKTLTAISLLFAGFLLKPTPLCILDEADAALDEANTIKFARMLKSLSESIQFVVITHNRVTMEAADYIYGVTMEEPGASKVISLELEKIPEEVAG